MTTKSTANMNHTQKSSQSHLFNNKTYNNTSYKQLDNRKKESLRKHEERGLSTHEWQKNIEKNSKKLNRINICKLQENIKKNNEKKSQMKDYNSKKL